MSKQVDPGKFGIRGKTVIDEVARNHYAIVINRKSRIIMADGKKLLDKATSIKRVKPGAKVSLKTFAPVCSKTKAFLREHHIEII